MKECTKPISQELLDNTINALEGWEIGRTTQIVIDVLEEKHDVKISLETRLAECGFSTRALNGMKCIGLETVSDLLSVPKTDLLKTHYIGKKTMSEIDRWVKDNEMLQKQLEHPWRSDPTTML
jgi:DNA-directed RNA polymerase alpha subunit